MVTFGFIQIEQNKPGARDEVVDDGVQLEEPAEMKQDLRDGPC